MAPAAATPRTNDHMYCQTCGALNSDEPEFCHRCQQKLLVVSGGFAAEELEVDEESEEGFSLDEHLLERISVLEEAVKRCPKQAIALED